MDTGENEAYEKIKMVHNDKGIIAYGVLCLWFTDVSGLGFAEQARTLTHPSPPMREEELADHLEM